VGAAAPERDPVVGRAGSARSEGTRFSGVVRDLRHRDRDDAGNPMTVVDFRIERHDASGNRLAPVPVQMRGQSYSGAVNNGDEIQVTNANWRDGTLRVTDLHNLSTGASVRAGQHRGWTIVTWVAVVVFVAFMAAIVISIIRSNADSGGPSKPPSGVCEDAERRGAPMPLGC
jgi:hypothetical protein